MPKNTRKTPKYLESAESIKRRMDSCGWDRPTLASEMGVTVSAVEQWLKGITRPSREKEARLVEVTDAARMKSTGTSLRGNSPAEQYVPTAMEVLMATTGPQIVQDFLDMEETPESLDRMRDLYMTLHPAIRWQIRRMVVTLAKVQDHRYRAYEEEREREASARLPVKTK